MNIKTYNGGRWMKRYILAVAVLMLLLCACQKADKSGLTWLKEGKYDKAKVAFQQEIREKKNLKNAYYGIGIACYELEQYEEAIAYFDLALQSKAEQSGTIASFLGACYMQIEDYESALEAYERALSDETTSAHLEQEAHYNLIAVYEKMGNWDAAKQQIEKYVQMYPNDTRVDKEQDFLEKR